MAQCTATSKRSGQRCKARAIRGRTTCRMHGGTAKVGPAAPQYDSGRYSKYLPERMLARYHEAEQDRELLALRAEVALIDSRLLDVLHRVDTGESSRIWGQLREAWLEVEAAQGSGDEPETQRALNRLGSLIRAGQADWAAWADVRSLIQERKRLVESERKRLVEAQRMIAVDQAMGLLALLVQAVHAHVRDPEAVRAVAAEYARLTGRPDAGPALADGGAQRRGG